MRFSRVLTVLGIATLAGCQTLSLFSASTAAPLRGTVWKIIELNAAPFEMPAANRTFALLLKKDGSFQAFAGCNELGGNYQQRANVLRLGPFLPTPKACTPSVLKLERIIVHAMEGGSFYKIENQQLSLLNPIGIALIRFSAAAPAGPAAAP
jgi:heat shock protein HslJ